MAVTKPTISMDPDLRAEAEALARAEGVSFSALVSDALRRRLQFARLSVLLDEWDAELGPPSPEVMAQARAELAQAKAAAHDATVKVATNAGAAAAKGAAHDASVSRTSRRAGKGRAS